MNHLTKSRLVTALAILLVIFWLITQFLEAKGPLYFILLLVAMYLFYEGRRLKKNKKSSLFDPDALYKMK